MATDEQLRRRWGRWVLVGVAVVLVVQVLSLVFAGGVLEVVLIFGSWLAVPVVVLVTAPLPRGAPPSHRRGERLALLVAPSAPMITYLVPAVWNGLHAESLPWLVIFGEAMGAALVFGATGVLFWLRLRRELGTRRPG